MARILFAKAVAVSTMAALSFLFSISNQCAIANAAEIKGLFASGVGVVTRELMPVFERTSGHKVTITYQNQRLPKRCLGDIEMLCNTLENLQLYSVMSLPPGILTDQHLTISVFNFAKASLKKPMGDIGKNIRQPFEFLGVNKKEILRESNHSPDTHFWKEERMMILAGLQAS